MNELFSRIMSTFDLLNDRVIAFREDKVVYSNKAAAALFQGNPIGTSLSVMVGKDQAKLITTIMADRSPARLDGVAVEGHRYNIKLSHIEDVLLLILTPEVETEDDLRFWTNYAMSAIGLQLRNQLGALLPAIKSLPSMLPDGRHEKLMRYLAIMNHNCHRLQRLSNNIADLASLADKDAVFTPACDDIVKFCKRLINDIRPLITMQGIKIRFLSSIPSVSLDFDADKIKRMLLNLISNSIKYTRDDNIITIKISRTEKHVFINVSDRGIGMSAETLNAVLNRLPGNFAAEDMHIWPVCGLGLALVGAIARLHNGIVALESREDVGTSVTISLPLDIQDYDYVGSNRTEYDYTGGYSPILVELSDILPYYFYLLERKDIEE